MNNYNTILDLLNHFTINDNELSEQDAAPAGGGAICRFCGRQ